MGTVAKDSLFLPYFVLRNQKHYLTYFRNALEIARIPISSTTSTYIEIEGNLANPGTVVDTNRDLVGVESLVEK